MPPARTFTHHKTGTEATMRTENIGSVRASLSSDDSEKPAKTYTTKHGTEATMRTENIGRPAVRHDHVEREGILPHVSTPRPVAKSRGIGLGYAHQAIACLQKIPSDDGLREVEPGLWRCRDCGEAWREVKPGRWARLRSCPAPPARRR